MKLLLLAALLAHAEGGNTLYVWFLPSARKSFSPAQAKGTVEAGNGFVRALKLGTRLVGFAAAEPFDCSGLHKSDVLAFVGEKDEALDFARRSGLLEAEDEWVRQDWAATRQNPEIGLEGRRMVFVGASAAAQFASELAGKATKEQAAALLIVHGAGHAAGLKHRDDGSFMDDGALLAANISGKGGFVSNGVLVRPRLTPIEALFDPSLVRALGASGYDDKYKTGNTQFAAWVKHFGLRSPPAEPPLCKALRCL